MPSKLQLKNSFYTDLSLEFFVIFGFMILLYYPTLIVTKRILSSFWTRIVAKVKYSVAFEKNNIFSYLKHGFTSIYLIFWGEVFSKAHLLSPLVEHLKSLFLATYSTIFISAGLLKTVNIVVDIISLKYESSKTPIQLHAQIVKILIISCATLIIVSSVLDLSLSALFASLGATAAVITFVFKDTASNLIAGLQLTIEDIIKIDDRIKIPTLNIEGVVETISITTLKIRNADNSISIIPTSFLLNSTVRNFRRIEEVGARRIKRSIFIDMKSIRFCDQEMIDGLKNLPLLQSVQLSRPDLFIVENSVSNIKIFRYYLYEYLRNNIHIHDTADFELVVRLLEPCSDGLPIDILAFSKETTFGAFEAVQSDITDHVVSIAHKFGLKIFQNLT